MPIKVIMADDHPIVIKGLRSLLESKTRDIIITGEAANGKQLLALAHRSPADVYVIDISMPLLNGIDTTVRLLRNDKKARVIILSMHGDRATMEKALKAGARGYLVKESAHDDIVKAIYEVNSGRCFVSPAVTGFVIDNMLGKTCNKFKTGGYDRLTSKEREIVQLIAEGMGNKEIAAELKVSVNTVHAHRNNVARKLDIHKQTQLVHYAIRENIVKK